MKSKILPKRLRGFETSSETSSETLTPRKTIPKKLMEAMSITELYDTGLKTPSIKDLIIQKEDFSVIQPRYCESFCSLPISQRSCDELKLGRSCSRRVDVLLVLPSKKPDEPTKYGKVNYGWSADELHSKILSYLVEKYLKGVSVELQYALKCRPHYRDKVSLTTIKNCSPYLINQIGQMRPKLVIFLGKEASQGAGIKKVQRGFIHYLEVNGLSIPTITTIHPKITTMIRQTSSGSFWGTDYLSILEYDFSKASDLLLGKVKATDIDYSIERFVSENLMVIDSVSAARRFRDEILALPQNTILAWDCETTSLDPWSEGARTLTYQFSYRIISEDRVVSVVVPLWHRDNHSYDPGEVFPYMREILESHNTVKIGHNIGFDIVFARIVEGVSPANVGFDTMLLLHSLNSGLQGFYDLKTATCDHLFHLQLAGYDDKIDLSALKRNAAKTIKASSKSEDTPDNCVAVVVDDINVF